MRPRRRLHAVLTGLGAAADDDGSVPPLQAALAQATGQGFLIEGHPEPAYNGLYARVGETPDGFPRFSNPSGMHLYRYQDYEQWFLWQVLRSPELPRCCLSPTLCVRSHSHAGSHRQRGLL